MNDIEIYNATLDDIFQDITNIKNLIENCIYNDDDELNRLYVDLDYLYSHYNEVFNLILRHNND